MWLNNLKRNTGADEEVQNFWEDVPWNRKWKEKKKGNEATG